MHVRQFSGRDDTAGIIRVHGLAWREAYEGLLPDDVLQERTVDPTEDDVDRWVERLRENEEGILVAVDDEEAVRGFVDLRWGDVETKAFVEDGEAGLRAIYVEPSHWGQGIGTALLERAWETLPDSVETVRLEVFSGNETARQFYEARGFERTDSGEYEIAGRSYPTSIYTFEF